MKYQFTFLTWLIVPLVLVFIAVSYLLNTLEQPSWHSLNVLANNWTAIAREESLPPPLDQAEWNGEGLITFWFDDAWVSQYDYALPILEKYGFKAAVAIPTGYIGFDNYMNWNQIKRLQFLGWETTAHSRTHRCDVIQMSESEINSEVTGSGLDLKDRGLRLNIYVLPCGVQSAKIANLSTRNYEGLRTVERGYNSLPVSNRYDLKIMEVNRGTTIEEVKGWIEQAKHNRSWLILTFHQVSNEELEHSEFAISPLMFEMVTHEVKVSELSVFLPSEVLNI